MRKEIFYPTSIISTYIFAYTVSYLSRVSVGNRREEGEV